MNADDWGFGLVFGLIVCAMIGALIWACSAGQREVTAGAQARVTAMFQAQGNGLEAASLKQYLTQCIAERARGSDKRTPKQSENLVIRQCLERARTETTLPPALIEKIYRQTGTDTSTREDGKLRSEQPAGGQPVNKLGTR